MISNGICNNQLKPSYLEDDYHNGHFERRRVVRETTLLNSLRVSFERLLSKGSRIWRLTVLVFEIYQKKRKKKKLIQTLPSKSLHSPGA